VTPLKSLVFEELSFSGEREISVLKICEGKKFLKAGQLNKIKD
jgi:hypothetical protein